MALVGEDSLLRATAVRVSDPARFAPPFAICNDELEGVALGFRGQGVDQTEREDALLEYAVCMRDNGYDMPDPNFDFTPGQGGGGGGTFTGPFGEIDPDDPAFVTAQQACEELLAGIGRGPGGRPGGGGA